tara:strand:- start:267 stop:728 length:462 start_codon:yes stop_codon:yes gene_type:complete
MKYCQVYNCRFNKTHTTLCHNCGICKKFGHGQFECKNQHLIDILKSKSLLDNMLPQDKWCTFKNCKQKEYHTTNAHHCSICYERNHDKHSCPKNVIKVICPICNKLNLLTSLNHKIFGLSEKCKICHCNEVNVFLPDCGHACMCNECLDIIKT